MARPIFSAPEKATEIQLTLGSDILMCFDECPPFPCTPEHARKALELTTRWAKRCQETFRPHADSGQLLYGITQGSIYRDLRRESTLALVDLDFQGYALGGLSLGEPRSATLEMVEASMEWLPLDKPRYLMGVGTPVDLWESVALGIDQFDCVLPTRNGRNGQLFTSQGKLNIKNAPYKDDLAPPDPECSCDLCSRYSRAYLHHLFRSGELSSMRLASLHNVAFLITLMRKIRKSLTDGNFAEEKQKFLSKYLGNSVV